MGWFNHQLVFIFLVGGGEMEGLGGFAGWFFRNCGILSLDAFFFNVSFRSSGDPIFEAK